MLQYETLDIACGSNHIVAITGVLVLSYGLIIVHYLLIKIFCLWVKF